MRIPKAQRQRRPPLSKPQIYWAIVGHVPPARSAYAGTPKERAELFEFKYLNGTSAERDARLLQWRDEHAEDIEHAVQVHLDPIFAEWVAGVRHPGLFWWYDYRDLDQKYAAVLMNGGNE